MYFGNLIEAYEDELVVADFEAKLWQFGLKKWDTQKCTSRA